jgi:hypothetical protein
MQPTWLFQLTIGGGDWPTDQQVPGLIVHSACSTASTALPAPGSLEHVKTMF